jgi:hypothetical protein
MKSPCSHGKSPWHHHEILPSTSRKLPAPRLCPSAAAQHIGVHHLNGGVLQRWDTGRKNKNGFFGALISRWDDCAKKLLNSEQQKGVSENSVPLNPMVNDHYPY